MRQPPVDTVQAIALALLLHALVFLLVFFGLGWSRSEAPQAAGVAVSAELVDPDALSAAMQRSLDQAPEPLPVPEPEPAPEEAAPLPQPLPAPLPEDADITPQPAPQEQLPDPDVVEQERVRAEAEAELAAEREQEERRRQEQIELEERRKQEEAEQRRRLAQQQREADLRKLRAEREQVERDAREAEERLRRIADRQTQRQETAATASVPDSAGASGPSQGEWASAMVAAIERQWIRPDSVRAGMICPIRIRMLPGGEVMSAEVQPSCPYDDLAKRSVENAVLRASPLPWRGFESVAARDFVVRFQPSR